MKTPTVKYNMFLDDLRFAEKYYEGQMVTVRSYAEAVKYVEEHGLPEFVSFDHDLGDVGGDDEKTGYDFAKYLIEYMMNNEIHTPFQYYIHSANPVGAGNIRSYLTNAFQHI